MGGFEHPPARPGEPDSPRTAARNARYGLILFGVYLALYATYVLLNAFRPSVMDAVPWAGLNLAVLSGFGLIGAALLLALVYGWLCRAPESPPPGAGREGRV